MINRIRKSLYIFNKPFFLKSTGLTHMAGAYSIETEDEPLEGLSFEAYRHVSMTMIAQRQKAGAALQIYQIDRQELADAVAAYGPVKAAPIAVV
jgi:hypothetical protein